MVIQALSCNKKEGISDEINRDIAILRKEIKLLQELGLEDYEINYLVRCRIKDNAQEKWKGE